MEKKRKQRRYLSEEEKKEIITMAQDGSLTYKELADTYNVCDATISRVARSAGIKRQPRKKKNEESTTHEKESPSEPNLNISLLEHLEEASAAIEQDLRKWEAIKHEACHTLDKLRMKQQEYFIALQALKRAKEANQAK